MRITIINQPELNVGIDDRWIDSDLVGLDPGIHAVQWEDDHGVIEYADPDVEHKEIDSMDEFNDIIDAAHRQIDIDIKREADPYYALSEDEIKDLNSQLAEAELHGKLMDLSYNKTRTDHGISSIFTADEIEKIKARITYLDGVIKNPPIVPIDPENI